MALCSKRKATQISRLLARTCPRKNFQSDFQILTTTNLLGGASHALLTSLGSCARRIGCYGVSLPFFLVPPVVIFHLTARPQYHILFANIK